MNSSIQSNSTVFRVNNNDNDFAQVDCGVGDIDDDIELESDKLSAHFIQ